MPLRRGRSKAVRSANIGELAKSDPSRPIAQDVAIEFNRERKQEGLKDPGYGKKRPRSRG